MAKMQPKVVDEVIQIQTTDPLKSKGRTEKKSTFFWEKYTPTPLGKRGIITQWDAARERGEHWDPVFEKDPNGNYTGRITAWIPVQQAKKLAKTAKAS